MLRVPPCTDLRGTGGFQCSCQTGGTAGDSCPGPPGDLRRKMPEVWTAHKNGSRAVAAVGSPSTKATLVMGEECLVDKATEVWTACVASTTSTEQQGPASHLCCKNQLGGLSLVSRRQALTAQNHPVTGTSTDRPSGWPSQQAGQRLEGPWTLKSPLILSSGVRHRERGASGSPSQSFLRRGGPV